MRGRWWAVIDQHTKRELGENIYLQSMGRGEMQMCSSIALQSTVPTERPELHTLLQLPPCC